MKVYNQIDLWNDHKPSQTIDPFLDPNTQAPDYDEIIIIPNAIGVYKMNFEGDFNLDLSPEFNGGVIFLKNGDPIRLFLCHVNKAVTKQIGKDYNSQYIYDVIYNSTEKIGETGKTLLEILNESGVKISTDTFAYSKYKNSQSQKKTEPAFESADIMPVLTSKTFLNDTKDWESISFYPDITSDLTIVTERFTIDIHQKGLIAGIKKNQANLIPEQEGRKAYAIMLQTNDKEQYKQMVEFTEDFIKQVKKENHDEPSKDIFLDNSMLDR